MQKQGSYSIHGQYIKDISFENPNAPHSFNIEGEPQYDIAVNYGANPLENNFYEVAINLEVKRMHEDQIVFLCQTEYAGIFHVETEDQELLQFILLAKCTESLYPFARRLVSDLIRDAGYPPIILQPVDFLGLYNQRVGEASSKPTQNETIN